MNAFDLCATISLNTEKYEAGLKDAKKKAQNLAITDFGESYTNGFEKVAKTAIKVGTVVGGALTAIGGYAVKVGSDFEAGMSEVKAISGATETQMAMLEKQAAELGKTTKFSASEAAEGYKYMAMAGWDAKDMLDGLPGVLNLAAASGENLGTVSDIVTDALTAMGLEAKDSSHFSDVLAAAASNSNTNVAMMGQTFKYAAPLAGALKFSIEDLAIATGLMANAGIKESQAGTALRSTLTRLAKPPKECAEAMDAYNISMTDSEGNMKSLYDVMGNLRKSLGKLPEQEQAAAAAAIGGQEAMSGLLAIINASDKDFAKLTEAVYDSNGAAETMAKTMQDNLQGKIVILKSALEAVGVAAYKKFEEPLKNAVDKATEAINNFDLNAFIEKCKRVLDFIGKISPAIGGIVGALVGFYAYFKALNLIDKVGNILGQIKTACGIIAALGGPIGIIVALIGAVIAAVAILYAKNEDFRNKVNDILAQISDKLKALGEWLMPYVQAVMDFIGQTVANAVESLKPILDNMSSAFGHAWEIIKIIWQAASPFFDGILQYLQAQFEVVATFISSAFSVAWTVISSVWSVATSFFSALWATIDAIFAVVEGVLSGDFSAAWEAIKNALSGWSDFFMSLLQMIVDVFKDIGSFFLDVGKSMIKGISDGWTAAWNGFVDMVMGMVNAIIDRIKSAFRHIGVKIGGAGRSHAGGLDYVPYNNYSANLHRGEMVLTADEADKYRRGQRANNGFTVNQTIYAAKQTPVELAASTAAYFQQARWAL